MRALLVVLALAAALAVPAAAAAAPIAVTTTSDELNADGDCSLREAVEAANDDAAVDGCGAGAGADVVSLPAGRYELAVGAPGEDANQEGDLDVEESLAIVGDGSAGSCASAGSSCIDAAGLDRAIDVHNGFAPVGLALQDVTVADGDAGAGTGGGVSSQEADAVLTLEDAAVLSNEAATGGGIASAGTLVLRRAFLARNEASAEGGGVVQSGGSLASEASVFEGNEAAGGGAGIGAAGGAAVALGLTTFAGNASAGGDGGGVSLAAPGSLAVSGSTFTGNAADRGGALAAGVPPSVSASTFEGNRAAGTCGAGTGDGGALYASSSMAGAASVTNSTFVGNSAGCRGGAMRLFALAAPTAVVHVTFTDNAAGVGGGTIDNEEFLGAGSRVTLRASLLIGGTPSNCRGDGSRESVGYNLDSGISCGLGGAGDLLGVDPQLGPLRFNGGPTRTRVPATTSPIVNIVKSGCPEPAADQRGVPRPAALSCDAGAVELAPGPACVARAATVIGTLGPDTLRGTEGADVIAGLSGDDTLLGLGGNDVVCGGPGNDSMGGGAGNDRLRGEEGDDRLGGNGGRDHLEGGAGNDRLKGGRGKDRLDGGAGKNKKRQ